MGILSLSKMKGTPKISGKQQADGLMELPGGDKNKVVTEGGTNTLVVAS